MHITVSRTTDDESVSDEDVRDAARETLRAYGVASAEVGVVLVSDPELHELNKNFLGHDWTTDVVTFPFGEADGDADGEIYVSVDTALREATEAGRELRDELLLYVVHGALHLCGLDDREPADRAEMRAAEQGVLKTLGIAPHSFE